MPLKSCKRVMISKPSPPIKAIMHLKENDENLRKEVNGNSTRATPSINTFLFNIQMGNEKIGYAKIDLVDRESIKRGKFHCTCYDYSTDLGVISEFFCNDNGKANHWLNIYGHDSSSSCGEGVSGGFLYIKEFVLSDVTKKNGCLSSSNNTSRKSDIESDDDCTRNVAEALRSILNHPKLDCAWSLAIYSAETMQKDGINYSQDGKENKNTIFPSSSAQSSLDKRVSSTSPVNANKSITRELSLPSPQQNETQRNHTVQKYNRDKKNKNEITSFLRAGFRQVIPFFTTLHRPHQNKGCGATANDTTASTAYHFFAVPEFCRRRLLSHKEAIQKSTVLVNAQEKPLTPTGKDAEIRRFVRQHIMKSMEINSGFVRFDKKRQKIELKEGEGKIKINKDAFNLNQSKSHLSSPRRNNNGLKEFESSLAQLVKGGGSIKCSFALHECAKHGKIKEMDILLRFACSEISGSYDESNCCISSYEFNNDETKSLMKQIINTKNEEFLTPLMEASRSGTNNFLLYKSTTGANPFCENNINRTQPSDMIDFCDKLILYGADKSITDDATGLTALGHMRKEAVSCMQFVPGGYDAIMETLKDWTKLLMPDIGPSQTDEAILLHGSSLASATATTETTGEKSRSKKSTSSNDNIDAHYDKDYYDHPCDHYGMDDYYYDY